MDATNAAVAGHFRKSAPNVRATYDALVRAARSLGVVREEPKKTSIHLVRTHAFAGVAAQKGQLILTLKAERAVKSPRIRKSERLSANRWYFYVALAAPSDVDAELRTWLAASYGLA